jgi:hypothetical protein
MPTKNMMHELKAWSGSFQEMWNGTKLFDLRRADRDFQIDDTLRLREWDLMRERYTGRILLVQITHVMRPGAYPGLENGYVILGVRSLSRQAQMLAPAEQLPLRGIA